MTTDPGDEPKKTPDICPYCKEPYGTAHKTTCGLWSPYSNSKWVVRPEKPEATEGK